MQDREERDSTGQGRPAEPKSPVALARKKAPSSVERAKAASRRLRGGLRASLEDDASGLPDADQRIAKFHGIYQQEDRDARAVARLTGTARMQNFMLRIKIPAGQLTAEQYLAMDRLADEVVYNRSLRITTRQNFQFHGVLKGDLRKTIGRIDEVLLSTLSGCGDVERNIVAPPAPLAHTGHRALHALAVELTEALTPATNAYREIWFDGTRVDLDEESEPLYGEQYLPRKFKTGLALPEDNSADVHDQDVGLIGIVEDGLLVGANVLVGGGSGLTHRKSETYARLATPLGFVERARLVEAVKTIVMMYRDFGDRTDRGHSRMKYVVEEWGIPAFKAEFERRFPCALRPWVDTKPLEHRDWLGAHEQGDGRWVYGIYVENGRIIDGTHRRWKTALRTIVETLRPAVVLTAQQNLLLADLAEDDIAKVEKILEAYGIPLAQDLSLLRRNALACPSMPTCGLALAESERVASSIMSSLEDALVRARLDDSSISLRMTGCPNGCTRPYNADLGIVGRKPGHYDVFVGGGLEGTRLGELYMESVPIERIVTELEPLLKEWAQERRPKEGLGDFYDRSLRVADRRDILTGAKDPAARRVRDAGKGR